MLINHIYNKKFNTFYICKELPGKSGNSPESIAVRGFQVTGRPVTPVTF